MKGVVAIVDTVHEATEYLNGKNIVKENLYRICYLLSCHLKAEGASKVEARRRIFAWGSEYRVWIKYDVNSIITRAYEATKSCG